MKRKIMMELQKRRLEIQDKINELDSLADEKKKVLEMLDREIEDKKTNTKRIVLDEIKQMKNKNIYVVEKKYNGLNTLVHKKDGVVRIFDGEGNDYTKMFPDIVRQTMSSTVDDFILEGSIILVDLDGNTVNEEAVLEILSTAKNYNDFYDKETFFMASDCLFYKKDVTSNPWNQRRKYMNSMKFSKNFKLSPYLTVLDEDEAFKALRLFSNLSDSIGSVIKNYHGEYLTGVENNKIIECMSE